MRPNSFVARLASLAALVTVASGCMTTVTQALYFTGDKNVEDKCMVYIGTQANILLAATAVTDGPFHSVGHGAIPGIVGFLDFPLSLALDTVLLPLTIGETIVDALVCRPKSPDSGEVSDRAAPEEQGHAGPSRR